MKKLTPFLVLALALILPLSAYAAITVPWSATSTDPGFTFPARVNGNDSALKFTYFFATSTTATSTITRALTITGPGGAVDPYLLLSSTTPGYGYLQGDVVDAGGNDNRYFAINTFNNAVGNCAQSGFIANDNNPALTTGFSTIMMTNDGWTGIGCSLMSPSNVNPESTYVSNWGWDLDFVISTTTNTVAGIPVGFKWFTGGGASQVMTLTNQGRLGIGTTTPGSLFSIGSQNTGTNFYDNATTTKSGIGGVNIASGCFALNGTCISGSGGTNFFTQTGNNLQNNTGNALGINTAPNLAALEVQGTTSDATSRALQLWNSSATSLLTVRNDGNVGIASSSPNWPLSVTGTLWQNGNMAHFGNQACGTPMSVVGGSGAEFCGSDNSASGYNLILSNNNPGTSAFNDVYFQNDTADASLTHYAAVNYTSSKYNDNTFGTALNVPNVLNFTNTDGPSIFVNSTTTIGKAYTSFVEGGSAASNEIARFTPTFFGVGTTTTIVGGSPFFGVTLVNVAGTPSINGKLVRINDTSGASGGSAATMFSVGGSATTTDVFSVSDAAGGTYGNGMQIIGTTAGSGVTEQVTSANANEALSILPKGTGSWTLGNTTGGSSILNVGTGGTVGFRTGGTTVASIGNTSTFTSANGSGATGRFLFNLSAQTSGVTASIPFVTTYFNDGVNVLHTNGTPIGSQSDFRITGHTDQFQPTVSVANGTIASSSVLSVDGPSAPGTLANTTNSYGMYIGSGTGAFTTASTTNAVGLFVETPTGALNNFAAGFNGPSYVSSASTSAFTVGPSGATNPVLQIDSSTASGVSGVMIKNAATGGFTTIQATDPGTNGSLQILSKAGGNLNMNVPGSGTFNVATGGNVIFSTNGTFIAFSGQTSNTATNKRFSFTGAADTNLTASTEAPSAVFDLSQTRQHATGAIATQRDFRIAPTTHSFVGASTITNVATLSIDSPDNAGTNATLSTSTAILVQGGALSGTIGTSSAAILNASTGATNNYSLITNGRVAMTSLTTSGSTQTSYLCLNVAAEVVADSTTCTLSALKYKERIVELGKSLALQGQDDPLTIVKEAEAVSYYKKQSALMPGEQQTQHFGFIADWMLKYVPQLIVYGNDGKIQGFDYDGYIPVLNAAIAQQQKEIEALGGNVHKSLTDQWQWWAIGGLGVLVLLMFGWMISLQMQLTKLKK